MKIPIELRFTSPLSKLMREFAYELRFTIYIIFVNFLM